MVSFVAGALVGIAFATLFNRRGGYLCPRHSMPTYWDAGWNKERCSITHQDVNNEYEE